MKKAQISESLSDLDIPKEHKKALAELIAGKRLFTRLVISSEHYRDRHFEDPNRYRNDSDYLITLNCLGQLASKDYYGIPANVPEELSQILESLKLEYEATYKNGKLNYTVARDKQTLERVKKFKLLKTR